MLKAKTLVKNFIYCYLCVCVCVCVCVCGGGREREDRLRRLTLINAIYLLFMLINIANSNN